MTGAPRQASPRGRDPRISGDPILSARLSLVFLLALGLILVQGFGVPAARATEVAPVAPAAPDTAAPASRDSLAKEIRQYGRVIELLRDSLTINRPQDHLTAEQQARVEESIEEISAVIEGIGRELSDLELDISDNTISLVDEAGDGIIIRVPENLDEKLSEGFQAITQMVLEELPDTLTFGDTGGQWSMPDVAERLAEFTGRRPKKRRPVEGNIVRVGDALLVGVTEDVRGNVVVVLGDSEIEGRVDGNVIVVFGSLRLDAAAEITGRVVIVGGRLDNGEGAEVGDVLVIDPFGGPRMFGPRFFFERGMAGFLASQGLFILALAVALIAAMVAPEARFRAVLGAVTARPGRALGVGALVASLVHLGVAVLVVILVATVIGLPLALLVVGALAGAGAVAIAVTATAVGEGMCRRAGHTCPGRLWAVLAGMLVLHALSFVGAVLGLMPAVGALAVAVSMAGLVVKILAYAVGVGALVLSRFGSAAQRSEPPATDAAYSQQ